MVEDREDFGFVKGDVGCRKPDAGYRMPDTTSNRVRKKNILKCYIHNQRLANPTEI